MQLIADAVGVISNSQNDWAIARTKANENQKCQSKLRLFGVPFFVPTERVKRTYEKPDGSRKHKCYDRQLLPGYIFFELVPDAVDLLRATHNIGKIITDPTPSRLKRELLKFEEWMERDLEHYDTKIAPGRLVRIAEGGCFGSVGTVESIHKGVARLRVHVLGVSIVEVPIDRLELQED